MSSFTPVWTYPWAFSISGMPGTPRPRSIVIRYSKHFNWLLLMTELLTLSPRESQTILWRKLISTTWKDVDWPLNQQLCFHVLYLPQRSGTACVSLQTCLCVSLLLSHEVAELLHLGQKLLQLEWTLNHFSWPRLWLSLGGAKSHFCCFSASWSPRVWCSSIVSKPLIKNNPIPNWTNCTNWRLN